MNDVIWFLVVLSDMILVVGFCVWFFIDCGLCYIVLLLINIRLKVIKVCIWEIVGLVDVFFIIIV